MEGSNNLPYEPVIIEGEPVVIEGEPEVIEGEPEVIEGEPEVVEGEPVIAEGEPEVIEGEPVVVEGEDEDSEEGCGCCGNGDCLKPLLIGGLTLLVLWLGGNLLGAPIWPSLDL